MGGGGGWVGCVGGGVVDFKKGLPGADVFNSFPNNMIKLSVKKTKLTGTLATWSCAFILYILV